MDIRLRLREVNPKNINEAETLAVRLETLKLADRQKGRMIRKVGEQAPDLNPVCLVVAPEPDLHWFPWFIVFWS
jgi:hypothetical protein